MRKSFIEIINGIDNLDVGNSIWVLTDYMKYNGYLLTHHMKTAKHQANNEYDPVTILYHHPSEHERHSQWPEKYHFFSGKPGHCCPFS
jgi:hypothetical protein